LSRWHQVEDGLGQLADVGLGVKESGRVFNLLEKVEGAAEVGQISGQLKLVEHFCSNRKLFGQTKNFELKLLHQRSQNDSAVETIFFGQSDFLIFGKNL